MTIKTLGMGIVKFLKTKAPRKTLTISGSPKPKHRTVIIKKPSKTKLADTWQDRRIDAINRKIKKTQNAPDYAQEASDIYTSKAKTKKEYKAGKK